jgi:DNA topoisomerase IA
LRSAYRAIIDVPTFEALRTAKRVWLATDCDREGQLIGQEILEHHKYRGQVMRVLFTAQDSKTVRDAFGRAKPNTEYANLYAAAVARRQADQINNLSLTRTATVIFGRDSRRMIGVGRVKTPTLAIVCKRELEISNCVPLAYFEIVATASVAGARGRRTELLRARSRRPLPMRLGTSRVRSPCASKICGKPRQSSGASLAAGKDSQGLSPPARPVHNPIGSSSFHPGRAMH